jgi:hypothetical protein
MTVGGGGSNAIFDSGGANSITRDDSRSSNIFLARK